MFQLSVFQLLKTMQQSGANLLCIEAHKTIILDEPQFVAAANNARIAVIACSNDSVQFLQTNLGD